MDDKYDNNVPGTGRKRMARRIRSRQKPRETKTPYELYRPKGYDPELLYVECGRCGAPVLWEPGKATHLLDQAGVDPIELDPSCILVTDSCPACGQNQDCSVRIFRVSDTSYDNFPPTHGNA